MRRNILLVLKFLGLITAHPGVLKLTLKSNINGVSGSKALAPPRHQRRAMQCRAVPPRVLGYHCVGWGHRTFLRRILHVYEMDTQHTIDFVDIFKAAT